MQMLRALLRSSNQQPLSLPKVELQKSLSISTPITSSFPGQSQPVTDQQQQPNGMLSCRCFSEAAEQHSSDPVAGGTPHSPTLGPTSLQAGIKFEPESPMHTGSVYGSSEGTGSIRTGLSAWRAAASSSSSGSSSFSMDDEDLLGGSSSPESSVHVPSRLELDAAASPVRCTSSGDGLSTPPKCYRGTALGSGGSGARSSGGLGASPLGMVTLANAPTGSQQALLEGTPASGAVLQHCTSLYTSSEGHYARVLHQQGHNAVAASAAAGAAANKPSMPPPAAAAAVNARLQSRVGQSAGGLGLQHSMSSSALSSSMQAHAVAAVVPGYMPMTEKQQQQQHAHAADAAKSRPLSRSWSWPWGFPSFGSCSSSSSGSVMHSGPEADAAVAGIATTPGLRPQSAGSGSSSSSSSNSRRLMLEAGLAAVAGVPALHPAVQAYLLGSMGVGFSGGGFRYTYHVGVMDVLLHHLNLVGPECHVSGASSGALVAVFTKCGLPMRKVLDLTNKFSQDCASNGVTGRLGVVLRAYLEAYLPEDAHLLCDGTTHLAVTSVWPNIRTRLHSSFPTRGDLINAMLASCHLPRLSDGTFTVNFKGKLQLDGGLLSVVTPPPRTDHSVLVCSMPSQQIAKLSAFISRPKQADISISPDSFQSWPFTRTETLGLALQPPTTDFIAHMVARGRADAMAWAESVGFTRNGLPVFPTAQRLEQLRQQVFGFAGVGAGAAAAIDGPLGWASTAACPQDAWLQQQQRMAAMAAAGAAGSSSSWQLFLSRVFDEGMQRWQRAEQQRSLAADSAATGLQGQLAVEAATSYAAEAAAVDAAAAAAAAVAAKAPTRRSTAPASAAAAAIDDVEPSLDWM